jgi:hypothetical protein
MTRALEAQSIMVGDACRCANIHFTSAFHSIAICGPINEAPKLWLMATRFVEHRSAR